jgi:mono/diheme cytochrome c family protein
MLKVSACAAIVLFLGSIGLTAGSTSGSAPLFNEALFKAKCAMCHGADGSGNTAMGKKLQVRDLRSGAVQSQSDAALLGIITKGKGKMPAYEKSLGSGKCQELLAYVRQLGRR